MIITMSVKVLREETADDQCETTADINALKNKVAAMNFIMILIMMIIVMIIVRPLPISMLSKKKVAMILMVVMMILRMI